MELTYSEQLKRQHRKEMVNRFLDGAAFVLSILLLGWVCLFASV